MAERKARGIACTTRQQHYSEYRDDFEAAVRIAIMDGFVDPGRASSPATWLGSPRRRPLCGQRCCPARAA